MKLVSIVCGGLFIMAGIVKGSQEKDFGMIIMGVAIGVVTIYFGFKKKAPKVDKAKRKREHQRYKYYLTNEGKKALMEVLPSDELYEDWDNIARMYSTDEAQEYLMSLLKENNEEEIK